MMYVATWQCLAIYRAEFLTALARFGVSPFQYDADEIVQEVAGG